MNFAKVSEKLNTLDKKLKEEISSPFVRELTRNLIGLVYDIDNHHQNLERGIETLKTLGETNNYFSEYRYYQGKLMAYIYVLELLQQQRFVKMIYDKRGIKFISGGASATDISYERFMNKLEERQRKLEIGV